VGIGPDYTDHAKDLLGSGMSAYPELYPKDTWHTYPPGLGTYGETGNVTVELGRRGHTDRDILKILGENFMRVLGACLDRSQQACVSVRSS
jgi:microsomal dipeptidase-like Zn-dependent dipeptidase